ncbi:hypothetical protein ACRALDRAFT_2047029 [Sodiomyces alcalophilus JCM 7366]|uniref:uncharacterized protein n=1 Tax=Sodiomyces alcalophilus JCM 7366 TaxID=591952 RepID=UPI0039B49F6B
MPLARIQTPAARSAIQSEDEEVGQKFVVPANYIDFYGDPFNLVTGPSPKRRKDKGKGKEKVKEKVDEKGKAKAIPGSPGTNGSSDGESVIEPSTSGDVPISDAAPHGDDDAIIDWTRYEPPEAAKDTRDVTDSILLDIIAASIDNIKARIAEDDERNRRLQEAAARQREAEEENARQDGPGEETEPYFPIIIPPEEHERRPEPELQQQQSDIKEHLDANIAGSMLALGKGSSTPREPMPRGSSLKRQKNRRFNISRFLRVGGRGDYHGPGPLWANDVYNDAFAHTNNTPKGKALATEEPKATTHLIPEPEPEPEPIEQVCRPKNRECVSCLDDFPSTGVIRVPCHSYCPECFERLIATACQQEQYWPPKCCLNEIPAQTIRSHLPQDSQLRDSLAARSIEWNIPVGDRIYCSLPACSMFVPPANVNPADRTARCPAGHATCTLCREPPHPNTDACPLDRNAALTEALAEEEGWLHCARCRALVEHSDACQHMTCRCGYEFCYVCAAAWQTCRCTMDDLHLKKTMAATRREERTRIEAREEAELREALRQIEEFEREEARKAELLRQERERREAERRAREERARARAEAIRRRLVETRFAGLRNTLDRLGDEHRLLLQHHHDVEEDSARDEEATARNRLETEHADRRAELDAALEAQVMERAAALRREYAARVHAERHVESAYLRQLEQFYAATRAKNPAAADAATARAMKELRRKLDQGWCAWTRWRDDELATFKVRAEEERVIREEGLDAARYRLEERLAADAREMARRHAAERRWLDVVAVERARMLVDRETREMQEGDDGPALKFSDEESDHGGGHDDHEQDDGQEPGMAR